MFLKANKFLGFILLSLCILSCAPIFDSIGTTAHGNGEVSTLGLKIELAVKSCRESRVCLEVLIDNTFDRDVCLPIHRLPNKKSLEGSNPIFSVKDIETGKYLMRRGLITHSKNYHSWSAPLPIYYIFKGTELSKEYDIANLYHYEPDTAYSGQIVLQAYFCDEFYKEGSSPLKLEGNISFKMGE